MARKPDNTRANIGFIFLIILGLVIGIFLRRVQLGLIIGLAIGVLASGTFFRRR